ncbi:MAG: GNAT family N-acetyltransferase [Ruminococcus sp.]|nr:GNAT family N-acetyltransferase [Ruminococcus sp.]
MFREIRESDRELYYRYADIFYHTDAVNAPVPSENYEATFNECLRSDAYLKCYFFEWEGVPCGFSLLSKTFSQEAGGVSVTIEEIYIDEEYRGRGLATEFFRYLKSIPEIMRLRIEVEDDNTGAKRLYERMGFEELPYLQMVIDRQRKQTNDSDLEK